MGVGNMDKIVLPIAIGIIVDDVGWHDGRDLRYMNGSARSGLPRFHHPDDVRALNAIGKALNTKIICSLVLGEWDKDNVLRGVPAVTPDPENWDAAAVMDMEYTKEYFKALEESEFLDYSLHGLLHAYYDGAKLNTARQYYPNTYAEDGKINGYRWLPAEEFGKMIDLFYEIYGSWGFKKKITTFVSPCGCWGVPEDEGNIGYAKMLLKHGIKYWCNSWAEFKKPIGNALGIMAVRGDNIAPWNAYDIDPDYLEPLEELGPYYCGHLTNFIRYNYQKNFEYVEKWAKYFRKYSDRFGAMMARNIDESCSQMLYVKNAKLTECDGVVTVDLAEVDSFGANGLFDEFFISIEGDHSPKILTEGASIDYYECGDGYKTYKIKRCGAKLVSFALN